MLRFTLPTDRAMDLDDLRVALVAAVTARQQKSELLLCFDDLRPTHHPQSTDEEQKLILEKFAVAPHRILHYGDQLHRARQLALRLVEEGKAFLCFCSPDKLREEREAAEALGRPYRYSGHCAQLSREELQEIKARGLPFSVRIRKPKEAIRFHDLCEGELLYEPEAIDHFVLLRSDGTPTETFAAACCDIFSGTKSAVLKADERLQTARSIHIQRALDYRETIRYAHLPPILDTEGRKIAHHPERYSLKALLEAGFLPDAILNALLSLGSTPPREVFTLPEALEWFDLTRLSPEAVPLDLQRLEKLNREHLRRMDDLALSRLFRFADADIGRMAKLYLDAAPTLGELKKRIDAIFAPKPCDEEMRRLSRLIIEAPAFDRYEDLRRYLAEHSGLTPELVDSLMERLLRGSSDGPAPSRLYPHLKSYITEVVRCQP
ncbi:glutamate--tRNA ligase family protein [Nitratifractor sp.]